MPIVWVIFLLLAEVHRSYVSWLGSFPWQIFLTLTSDHQTHPEALEKRWRFIIGKINTHLYGAHWQRRSGGLNWVLGIERHKSGNPHCHGLFYSSDLDLTDRRIFSYSHWKNFADNTGGFTWLEPVLSGVDLLRYVTKYVLKDGDVVLSPMIGKPQQGSLLRTPVAIGKRRESAAPVVTGYAMGDR